MISTLYTLPTGVVINLVCVIGVSGYFEGDQWTIFMGARDFSFRESELNRDAFVRHWRTLMDFVYG